MSETRTCGACTACCKAMPVPELEKPADQWCRHCTIGVGCQIHESRPETCQRYTCAWILNPGGGFSEEDRPNRLHVIFDFGPNELVSAQEGSWRVFELTPGALDNRRATQLLKRLVALERLVVITRHGQDRRMVARHPRLVFNEKGLRALEILEGEGRT